MSHTPNNISINILYEDPQIIVCVKPPGIATQSRSLAAPDMVRLLKKHLYTGRPAGEPYLAVIHRLDQPVSGILVFAKTPAAARELNRQLQASDSQSFGKYYRALTAKKAAAKFRRTGKLHVQRLHAATPPESAAPILPEQSWPVWNIRSLTTASDGDGGFLKIPVPIRSRQPTYPHFHRPAPPDPCTTGKYRLPHYR